MALSKEILEYQIKINTGDAQANVKELSASVGGLGASFSKVGASIIVFNQALSLAATAYNALAGPIKATIGAYVKQEQVATNLANALKLTGTFTKAAIKDFQDFASEIQKTTVVEDDAALSLITLGKSVGLTNEQAKKFTKTAVDLSAATGMGLNESFQTLLDTMKGTTRTLSRYVPELRGLTDQQILAGEAVDLVAKKFDGFAKGQVQSTGGAIAQLGNAWGDLQEQIGKFLVDNLGLVSVFQAIKGALEAAGPVIEAFSSKLGEIVRTAKDAIIALDLSGVFERNKVAILAATIPLGVYMGMLAVANWQTISLAITGVAASFYAMAASIAAAVAAALPVIATVAAISAAVAGVIIAIDLLIRNFGKLGEVAKVILSDIKQYFYNLALEALGVMDRVFSSDVLKKKMDEIRKEMNDTAISTKELSKNIDWGLGGDLANSLSKAWNVVTGKIEDFKKATDKLGDSTKDAGNAMRNLPKIQPPNEETLKKYEALVKVVDSLRDEIKKLSVTEDEYLKYSSDKIVKEINSVREALKAEGRLTNDKAKVLSEALSLVAKKQVIDQAELNKKMIDQSIDAQIKIAEILGDSYQVIELQAKKAIIELEKLADIKAGTKGPLINKEQLDYGKKAIEAEKLKKLSEIEASKLTELSTNRFNESLQDNYQLLVPIKDTYEDILKTADEILLKRNNENIESKQLLINELKLKALSLEKLQFMAESEYNSKFMSDETKDLVKYDKNRLELLEKMNKMYKAHVVITKEITDLKNEENEKRDSEKFSKRMQFAQNTVSAINSGISGIVTAIGSMFGPIGQLVASVVNMLNRSEAEMQKFVESLIDSANKLPENLARNIPTVLKSIVDKLPDSLSSVMNTIAILFERLFSPSFFMKLMEGLLIAINKTLYQIPRIALNILSGIGKIIARSMLEALNYKMWIRVGRELVKALVQSFYDFFDWLAEVFSGNFKTFTESYGSEDKGTGGSESSKNRGKKSNSSEELFAVKDLQDKANDAFSKIKDAFDIGARRASDFLKEAWKIIGGIFKLLVIDPLLFAFNSAIAPFMLLWESLKATFAVMNEMALSFDKNIIQPALALFSYLVETFSSTVIMPAIEFFKNIGNDFVDLIWNPVKETIKVLGEFFLNVFDDPIQAFKDLFDGFVKIFQGVIEGIGNVLNRWIGWVKDLGGAIWDGLVNGVSKVKNIFVGVGTWIVDGFSSAIKGIGNFLARMFSFDGAGKGVVENFLGFDFPWVAFAEGGLVPGIAKVQGDSLKNDTVPALLSPGEVVLPRSAMGDEAFKRVVMAKLSGQKIPQYAFGWGDIKRAGAAIATGGLSEAGKAAEYVIPEWIQKLFDSISRFIGGIDIIKLITDPRAALEGVIKANISVFRPYFLKMMHGNGFATGGSVGGVGLGDTVPAMLTPGEFVLSRGAVNSLGVPLLNQLNSGAFSGLGRGGGDISNEFNITLNIKTEQPIDQSFIRSKIIPEIENSIRRSSLDGRRVLAPTGVRS